MKKDDKKAETADDKPGRNEVFREKEMMKRKGIKSATMIMKNAAQMARRRRSGCRMALMWTLGKE